MEQLTYIVKVDSGDRSADRDYLLKLRDLFRIITEDLATFTRDESISFSDINTVNNDG